MRVAMSFMSLSFLFNGPPNAREAKCHNGRFLKLASFDLDTSYIHWVHAMPGPAS